MMEPDLTTSCYHCGAPVPAGVHIQARIGDQDVAMCCHGCRAVAEAIVGGGLGDFYRHRTAAAATPVELPETKQRELALFDRDDIQQDFVRRIAPDQSECTLIIGGITCAACIWLLERFAAEQPGVQSFQVNHSTHRALLTWDPTQLALGTFLRQLHEIGYEAYPYHPDREQQLQEKLNKQMLIRICVAGFGMMQSMMFAIPLYLHLIEDISGSMIQLFRWFSLVLTIPVILYAANPFTQAALRDLKLRSLTMDVPVALALWLAFLASLWVTLFGGREVYYESVCMFTFLLLLSRYIERKVRQRSSLSTSRLLHGLPASAIRIVKGVEQAVAVKDLQKGDLVRVKPGEIIPADGIIREGHSSIDEAALTGEYLPVNKQPGDTLIGGTVNIETPLVLEITAVGEDTQLSAIRRIMERAGRDRPPVAQLANRIAGYFIAGILIICLVIGWYWWQQDPALAFRIVLSVLVVTCPCALSLATPTALTAATTALQQKGFLITRSHVLEGLAGATTLVFDKTGTLTEGRLVIEEVIPSGPYSREEVLAQAAALERHSAHPIAAAFRPYASEFAQDVQAYPGLGLEGLVNGERLRIGVAEFALADRAQGQWQAPETPGHWIALADQQNVRAWFRLNDRLRSESYEAMDALRQLGLKLMILSGDRSTMVTQVGQQLGMDHVQGGCSPEDKLQYLQELQAAGEQVVMVGDGINDVPGMAGAQLSIAMNNASDLTRINADAILLSGNLLGLASALATARRTRAIIRQNLGWALLYNVLALPLAAMGQVEPWQAAIGMSVSSLVVALNALRLNRRPNLLAGTPARLANTATS